MTVFDKLLEPVLPILQQIESERSKHWRETLRWFDLVRALVYYFTKRCGSRNAWAVALANADPALHLPAIPRMTLSDGLRRFPPSLLRRALVALLATRELPNNPELSFLGAVFAVDGSEFPIFNGMSLPKTTDSIDRVKLHLKLSLQQLIAVDFVLGIEEASERTAFRHFIEQGATYVLDRGYMAFSLLRDCIIAQAFVVMRAYSTIAVETVTELPPHVPTYIAQHWMDIRDRLVQSHHPDAAGLVFRLVEFTIGETTYKLITNHMELSTFQVLLLYAYRWQIELIFRFFKQTMRGMEVINIYPWGMENFFTAMLLTAILHMYFKQDCLASEGHHPPTDQELGRELPEVYHQISGDTTRPTAQLAMARFMEAANRRLALFWKIPKHWLATVADYLYRPFTTEVIHLFNQRAFECCMLR
jgi:hypothetical protein